MTLLPSFHWPRFFNNSTRSKRFKTLRLAAIVLAPFKLRCCDMDSGKRLQELQRKRAGTLSVDRNFSNRDRKSVAAALARASGAQCGQIFTIGC
jgi:hypothetical protein